MFDGSSMQASVQLHCQQLDFEWGVGRCDEGVQLRWRWNINVRVDDAAMLNMEPPSPQVLPTKGKRYPSFQESVDSW